jgi:glycosyltransferase involved in cell wall biosynthesis
MKVIFKVIKAGSGNDVYFQRLSEALKQVNVDSVIEYYPKYFQYFPWALKFVNRKTPGDIIHSNVEYGWVFKEKDKPLYLTLHHNVFDNEYRKYTTVPQRIFHDFIIKPNTKKSLRRANKVIAVSNYTKRSFVETFGKYPIEVIYNFVDTDKYKPMKVKMSDKRFKLLFVGNLTKRKGADLLPEIMSKLDPKEYVLYYTSGLRTRIPKEFNLPHMIALGKLSEDNLVMEYNKCDALLFPSRFEGFGYAVIEAMACGKPVITSNKSSMPEIVINNVNGFVFDLDNLRDVLKKIEILSAFRNTRKISLDNRAKVIKNFSFSSNLIKKLKYEFF